MIKAKDYILKIDPYRPGKSDIGGQKGVIKLSSNENALGSSKKAIEAYESHSSKIFRYASGGCEKLREALASKYNIEFDGIVCGAGSDEIIALLVQSFCGAGDEVLYSDHGFLMYPISAKRVGSLPVAAKEINLTTSIDNILTKISDKTKMIFIANPNNPTGSYLDVGEVRRLLELVPKDIIIVLDQAYSEFVDKKDYIDATYLVKEHKNLVVTRTFSKIFGLASLRLGWSYSSAYIADILHRMRGPFNVSGAAQAAGIASINDKEFIEESKNYNNKWLEIVSQELKNIGLKIYPSIANFILIDFGSPQKCIEANKFLLENGIILREMQAYKLPSCLRMTIGSKEENQMVIKLFQEFIVGYDK